MNITKDFEAFKSSLNKLLAKKGSPLVYFTVWQNFEGKRYIYRCTCRDIDFENHRLLIQPIESDSKSSNELSNNTLLKPFFVEGEIFVYVEKSKIIFKSLDFVVQDENLNLKFPEEILCLTESENTDILKSTKVSGGSGHFTSEKIMHNSKREHIGNNLLSASMKTEKIVTHQTVKSLNESEVFKHKRAAPRARPKSKKQVTLQIKGQPETSKEYELYDLSTGGLSFVITKSDLLHKNDLLDFTAFDSKPVEASMIGIIRNIREEGPNRFRVGVQFTTD